LSRHPKGCQPKATKAGRLAEPSISGFLQASTDLGPGPQVLADQAKHTLIPDLPGYAVHEHVVVDPVEGKL